MTTVPVPARSVPTGLPGHVELPTEFPVRTPFPLPVDGVYANSAFTSFTPGVVTDVLQEYYAGYRGSPTGRNEVVNERIGAAFETFREYFGAVSRDDVVFTKSCTEAINYAALSLAPRWGRGDRVLVSQGEYAPNVLPWFRLAAQGVEVRVLPLRGTVVDLDALADAVDDRTRLVALCQVSNLFGGANPVRQVARLAHEVGALVLVDGSQATSYLPVDVADLGADLYTVSGHKALGPTGSGLLLCQGEAVRGLPPLFLGDSGIEMTAEGELRYAADFTRFFGGFSDAAQILGLARALRFGVELGLAATRDHLRPLAGALAAALAELDGLRVVSDPAAASLVSVTTGDDAANRELWAALEEARITTQLLELVEFPLLRSIAGAGTVIRCSLHLYNGLDDVERIVSVVRAATLGRPAVPAARPAATGARGTGAAPSPWPGGGAAADWVTRGPADTSPDTGEHPHPWLRYRLDRDELARASTVPGVGVRPYPGQGLDGIRSLVEGLWDGSSRYLGSAESVILLGLDGVGYGPVADSLQPDLLMPLTSVFPTASACAWMTVNTGLPVEQHLVPGVTYRLADADVVYHCFRHRVLDRGTDWERALPAGSLGPVPVRTLFQALADRGVSSVASLGSLERFDSAWREALLAGAGRIGRALDWAPVLADPGRVVDTALDSVAQALSARAGGRGLFTWAWVNVDPYIHKHGYDRPLREALCRLGAAAERWASAGHTVLLVSDHGAVPATDPAAVRQAWDEVNAGYCRLPWAGAGRVLWCYPRAGQTELVAERLADALGGGGLVLRREELGELGLLRLNGPLREAIGEVVLVATTALFPTPEPAYRWEHGAVDPEEMIVPLAMWFGTGAARPAGRQS